MDLNSNPLTLLESLVSMATTCIPRIHRTRHSRTRPHVGLRFRFSLARGAGIPQDRSEQGRSTTRSLHGVLHGAIGWLDTHVVAIGTRGAQCARSSPHFFFRIAMGRVCLRGVRGWPCEVMVQEESSWAGHIWQVSQKENVIPSTYCV